MTTPAFQPLLGFSLHKLDPSPAAEVFEVVQASRIDTFEIFFDLFQGPRGKEIRGLYENMLERSGKRTATVHASYGPKIDLSASDPAVRAGALDSTLRAMELAAELGAPIVVLHASVEPIDDAQRAGHLERAGDSLRVVAEQCRQTGRQAAVELLPRSCLGHTADELLHMVDPLDPEVIGVCIDTNHLMDRPQELADTVRTLAPRLLTLHLSDYDGVDEKHWLPGQGVVNWPAFMNALAEIGYTGPFNFECTPPGETPVQRLRTLEQTFDWLRGLVS